jgi:hypothetical protein
MMEQSPQRQRDGQEILELVSAAVDADDLIVEDEGGDGLSSVGLPARRGWPCWALLIPTAAAAVLAIWLVRDPLPIIREVHLQSALRSSSEDMWGLEVSLRRPAAVAVVVIDARLERWLVPFDAEGGVYWSRVRESHSILVPTLPNPGDGLGAAQSRYVLLLVSAQRPPTAADLLAAIPDPVSSDASDADVELRLNDIAAALKDRFGLETRVVTLR